MKFPAILRRLVSDFAMLGLTLTTGEALAQQAKPVVELKNYAELFDAVEKDKTKRIMFLVINEGLLDGVLAAHAAFTKTGAPPRICMKTGVEFKFNEQFVNAIGEELMANHKGYDALGTVDMGVVALYAMQRRFPCR
jgi:hypothetical protein